MRLRLSRTRKSRKLSSRPRRVQKFLPPERREEGSFQREMTSVHAVKYPCYETKQRQGNRITNVNIPHEHRHETSKEDY